VSAIFAVIFLSAAVLLAMAAMVIEVSRLQHAPIGGAGMCLQVTFLASILVLVVSCASTSPVLG
jgi:hypothetical protein